MTTEPILREVYRIKDQFNRKTGGDVGKLMERINEFARQHPERMVSPEQVDKISGRKPAKG